MVHLGGWHLAGWQARMFSWVLCESHAVLALAGGHGGSSFAGKKSGCRRVGVGESDHRLTGARNLAGGTRRICRSQSRSRYTVHPQGLYTVASFPCFETA